MFIEITEISGIKTLINKTHILYVSKFGKNNCKISIVSFSHVNHIYVNENYEQVKELLNEWMKMFVEVTERGGIKMLFNKNYIVNVLQKEKESCRISTISNDGFNEIYINEDYQEIKTLIV